MLEVIEIQQKASQGRTEPYLCRLSDDKRYSIKGPQAGTVKFATALLRFLATSYTAL